MVDELKGECAVASISCRWPLTIFFALINIAGINNQIISRENTNDIITHRLYSKTLGKELTKNYMHRRLKKKKTLSIPLGQTILKQTGCVEEPTVSPTSMKSRNVNCVQKEKIVKNNGKFALWLFIIFIIL